VEGKAVPASSVIVLSLLNGTVYGLLLFMLCSGLTLIYSMMGVLNLAHASFYMLGAYFAYQISLYLGFWPALVAAPVLVGLVGAAVEHWGLRHVHRSGHGAELLFTFGLALLIHEVVSVVWGRLPVSYRIPPALDFPAFILFGNDYSAYRLFALAVSIGMFAALFVVLRATRIGLIIQAALTKPDMVAMLGHDVSRIFSLVFGLGCGLAGLAGVIGGNMLATEPDMAQSFAALVFVVVVIGGLGSLAGALIASLLIGIIQTLGVAIDASPATLLAQFGVTVAAGSQLHQLATLTLAHIAPILPYLLLVLTLIVRPRGLMGRRET
jgi:branched-chain amino acid transport system permease protein